MKHFSTYFMVVLLLSTLGVDTEMLVVLKHCANVFNKAYIDKLLTPRKPINRTTSLTSLDIYFKKDVVLNAPLYLHIETFRKFATQYKPIMVDYTLDMCEAIIQKTHPLYIMFYAKTNETDSNYMDPCPMKGHVFIRPYYTSYEYLPPLFPTGTWRVDITLLKGRVEKVFTLKNFYEVTSTGITDF